MAAARARWITRPQSGRPGVLCVVSWIAGPCNQPATVEKGGLCDARAPWSAHLSARRVAKQPSWRVLRQVGNRAHGDSSELCEVASGCGGVPTVARTGRVEPASPCKPDMSSLEVILNWKRFDTFRQARTQFRK